ncbi:MAG: methylmalonyl-CoA epimerase [Candidatus Marinimicrobia bacterium]|nr:methylmalonyl-CoA epimerase [Candidatus Neomarinimicrobiota bacterium]
MKRNFKILSIDHIAVATNNFNNLYSLFVDILGMESSNKETITSELVDVVKLYPKNGDTSIEIIEPIENNNTINKFIDKNNQAIHHIALNVDNIENAISFLKYKNITLVYDNPKIGANNKLITFIHPKSSPGVLIELCQKQ